MTTPLRSYKPLLSALALSVVLLLLFGVAQFFRYNPESITRRFQKTFNEQEIKILDSLHLWADCEDASVWTDPERGSDVTDLWTVLRYENDQLKAWSSREMDASKHWDPADTLAFYKTASGAYYRFFHEHDSLKWIVALNLQKWNPLRSGSDQRYQTPLLRASHQFKIDSQPSEYAIHDHRGQTQFYLHFPDTIAQTQTAQVLLFALLFFLFFSMLSLGFRCCQSFAKFLLWAFVCRALMFGILYAQSLGEVNFLESITTPHFSTRIPYFNAALGSICMNLLMGAMIMLYVSRSGILGRYLSLSQTKLIQGVKKVSVSILLIAFCAEIVCILRSIIIEFPISIDLKFAFNFDVLFGLMLFAIALIELCFVMLLTLLLRVWIPQKRLPSYNLMYLLWTMVVVTAAVAVLFNHFLEQRERQERLSYAADMVHSRLPEAEIRFRQTALEICTDSTLKNWPAERLSEERLLSYFKERYFTKGWEVFDMEMTICEPQTQLLIEEGNDTISCADYFEKTLKQYGRQISMQVTPGYEIRLYHLHYAPDYSTYIGRILLDTLENRVLYVEFMKNSAVSYLNIEALSDNRWRLLSRLTSEYAYAYYESGDLLKSVGLFNYPLRGDRSICTGQRIEWVHASAYTHLVYPMPERGVLILSAREHTFWGQTSTFALLVLFNMVWLFVLYFLIHLPPRRIWASFTNRLQLLTLLIVIGSFAIIGSITVLYIERQNRQKNGDFLREKSYSTVLDLEYSYSGDSLLKNDAKLKMLVDDIATVLLANMNIYDPSGFLLYTTQPLLIESHLMSTRIHSSAYHALTQDHQNFYIQRELIANSSYYAMYVPLRNKQSKILGYVNLPMYSREMELRREISRFLTSFVSIYVWFMLMAMAVVSWLTRRMSQPLNEIAERMRTIDIHQANRKLPIQRSDEIGMLVNEYNRMVEELEQSTARLIQSEREGAWSEMARQIAHEIKNPLTPMKLSVQQIERAWHDQAADYPKRMERFVSLMIEQIEQLSSTANEFSNFAQMTQAKPEHIRVIEIAHQSLELFASNTQVRQELQTNMDPAQTLYCDPVLLRRVLINILKNAYQALENSPEPYVRLSVSMFERDHQRWCCIDLFNNGPEISSELLETIFEPNFTTKNSGMGLGLAISRKSIETLGGSLTLVHPPTGGVCFRVELPFFQDPELDKS